MMEMVFKEGDGGGVTPMHSFSVQVCTVFRVYISIKSIMGNMDQYIHDVVIETEGVKNELYFQ